MIYLKAEYGIDTGELSETESTAQKESHMYMNIWLVTKMTLQFSGERTAFSVDSAAATGYVHAGEMRCQDIPGSAVDKNLPAKAGDTGLILGLGRLHMPWGN